TPVTHKTAHVPVTGRVRRIFRGDARLGLGDEIHFTVAVLRPGDQPAAGGHSWLNLRDFEAAKCMEVFPNGTPRECAVADLRSLVIASPSDNTWVPLPTEE